MEPLRTFIGNAGLVLEAAGVIVILIGAVYATGRFLLTMRQTGAYGVYRRGLGRALLLGLEFLVAGDLIRTVVVDPSLATVGTLAIIVLIRAFLGLALEFELGGRWSWEAAHEKREAHTAHRGTFREK